MAYSRLALEIHNSTSLSLGLKLSWLKTALGRRAGSIKAGASDSRPSVPMLVRSRHHQTPPQRAPRSHETEVVKVQYEEMCLASFIEEDKVKYIVLVSVHMQERVIVNDVG
jgi:hypothetical protein